MKYCTGCCRSVCSCGWRSSGWQNDRQTSSRLCAVCRNTPIRKVLSLSRFKPILNVPPLGIAETVEPFRNQFLQMLRRKIALQQVFLMLVRMTRLGCAVCSKSVALLTSTWHYPVDALLVCFMVVRPKDKTDFVSRTQRFFWSKRRICSANRWSHICSWWSSGIHSW